MGIPTKSIPNFADSQVVPESHESRGMSKTADEVTPLLRWQRVCEQEEDTIPDQIKEIRLSEAAS